MICQFIELYPYCVVGSKKFVLLISEVRFTAHVFAQCKPPLKQGRVRRKSKAVWD